MFHGSAGFWSYGAYQIGGDPSDSIAFNLSGTGEMTIESWTNSGTVFNDLEAGKAFTNSRLRASFCELDRFVSWGLHRDRDDCSGSDRGELFRGPVSPLAIPFGKSFGPTCQSGLYSRNINFNVGETIGFVATGGGADESGLDINFAPFSPLIDPVPEPSQTIALVGLCCMGTI